MGAVEEHEKVNGKDSVWNGTHEAFGQVEEPFGAVNLLPGLFVIHGAAGVIVAAVPQFLSLHQIAVKLGRHPATLGKLPAESRNHRGVFGKGQSFPFEERLGYVEHGKIGA